MPQFMSGGDKCEENGKAKEKEINMGGRMGEAVLSSMGDKKSKTQ